MARGGVLYLKDIKEEVHDHMFRLRLNYTIIDVGLWYQRSFPGVPSGKFNYATFLPPNMVFNGGTARNMWMDKKDVGRITVQMIKDERTLNKRLYAYGEVLTQKEIHKIIEEKTGEKLELPSKSAEELERAVEVARAAAKSDPDDLANMYKLVGAQYDVSMYVREDNTPENAEYLGYVNGRELYPEFRYKTFAEFVDDLIAGKAKRPYAHVQV